MNISNPIPRKRCHLQTGYAYHVTIRCNNRGYIHGNPKAAKIRSGFFYEFSNYGSYDQLTDDGLTQWHPAFLQLGSSLEDCARKYRGFCKRYKEKSKPARKCNWGNKFLAGMDFKRTKSSEGLNRSREDRTNQKNQPHIIQLVRLCLYLPLLHQSRGARYRKARWYQQLQINSSGLTRLPDAFRSYFQKKLTLG